MKLVTTLLALAVAGALTTACDKPKTQGSAYNNSGASATTGSTTTTADSSSNAAAPTTTTSPATSDSSATTKMAPGPAGDASGAMSETLTTGKIKAAIAAETGLKDTDISVTTNNGVVTLGGTVKSQDQIALATQVAQKMDGVQKVEANLAVK